MDFSVVYLARRFLYRFLDFFHHWYIDGSRVIGRHFMSVITAADQSFAVAITLRHFFEPLYKDYSVIGRILGIVFRTFRILIGGVIYLVIALAFAVVYIIWLAIPAVILFYAAKHL
ncbi:MAG TPA: hypothetical protein VIJ29_03355 [Candidatus Paceibacterota bacterium]